MRNRIIEELYNDDMLKGYTKKLSPNNHEDVYQEFLLIVMTKISEQKLKELYDLKELNFYCVRIIKNMVINPSSPFNKAIGGTDVSYDVVADGFESEFSNSIIDEDSNVEDLSLSKESSDEMNLCIQEIKTWLGRRSFRVKDSFYDEKLFTKYFVDAMTFEEISEQTKIPKSEIYNNIMATQSVIQTKFNNRYYGIIN